MLALKMWRTGSFREATVTRHRYQFGNMLTVCLRRQQMWVQNQHGTLAVRCNRCNVMDVRYTFGLQSDSHATHGKLDSSCWLFVVVTSRCLLRNITLHNMLEGKVVCTLALLSVHRHNVTSCRT